MAWECDQRYASKKAVCDDLMHVTLSVIRSLVCEVFGCIGFNKCS